MPGVVPEERKAAATRNQVGPDEGKQPSQSGFMKEKKKSQHLPRAQTEGQKTSGPRVTPGVHRDQTAQL